jgi:glutamine synthetase
MNRQSTSARDVLKTIRENEIEFVDLKFVDLFGGLQHITFPADAIDEGSFSRGVNFDGSSVRGFQAISESDLILKPDPDSMFSDPFFDDPTISMFCDILDPDGHKPYSRDPRGVAQRAERVVRSLGLADAASFGVEMEFYLFDDVRFEQSSQHGYYFIDSEAAQHVGDRAPARLHRPRAKNAYFAAPPRDPSHNLRGKISKMMAVVGLAPEMHHHEVGSSGQNEIGFKFATLSNAADNAVKFKYVVKNTAHRYDKIATFMPKPLFGQAGSGMHTNVSVWQDSQNVFYEHGRYADLSEFAVHFIGGLLHHASAVCAFSAPTTNSYRRLVPGYEAPTIMQSVLSFARLIRRAIRICRWRPYCWRGSMASVIESNPRHQWTRIFTSLPRRNTGDCCRPRQQRWCSPSTPSKTTTPSSCRMAYLRKI